MRLVILSDTHGNRLKKWLIPEGDVLIHCGDFMKGRKLDEVKAFNDDLAAQPHKHKIVVAGNHDWPLMVDAEAARALLTAATYLEDEAVVIDGVKFYGSPWQPEYKNWAFNLPRSSPDLRAKWAAIPDDVDVLITHTPPYDVLDKTWPSNFRAGCELLRRRLEDIEPILHVFGHIHERRGHEKLDYKETLFVNAACVNYDYRVVYSPVVIDIDKESRKATIVHI